MVGYGFVSLFIPKSLRNVGLWLAPIFGTVLIAILGSIMSLGRLPMIKGVYWINLMALFFFLYARFAGKSRLLFFKSKKTICMIIILIFILPVFFRPSPDMSSFIPNSEFLIEHTVLETYTAGRTFDQNHYLIGISSLIAYFSVVLHQNVQTIANVLPTIYPILLFPLIFIFRKSINIIFKLMFVVVVYIGLKFFTPSLSQLVSLLVMLLIAVLLDQYFQEAKRIKDKPYHFNLIDVIIALVLASLALFYPLGFKLTIGVFIFLITMSCSFDKDRGLVFLLLAKIITLTILINPIAVRLVFL